MNTTPLSANELVTICKICWVMIAVLISLLIVFICKCDNKDREIANLESNVKILNEYKDKYMELNDKYLYTPSCSTCAMSDECEHSLSDYRTKYIACPFHAAPKYFERIGDLKDVE